MLPLTHEETMTFHARELRSHKELPAWYHFSIKERDERALAAACFAYANSS